MDTKDQLLVVGTADRQVAIFNLATPDRIYKTLVSPLKFQTRVVSCFTNGNGFAIASVEGRCAIQYVEDKVPPIPCRQPWELSQAPLFCVPFDLSGLEFEFLVPLSSRYAASESTGSYQRVLCQRNFIPPGPWHVLDCRLRRLIPFLVLHTHSP